MIEVREQVRPPSPYRLPAGGGLDGVLRRERPGLLARLVHVEDEPVVVRVAQLAGGDVLLGARARRRALGRRGIARMRFALGVDDDLRAFHRRFARDPLIGPAVRAAPWLRLRRRPAPFEALAWAVVEQLIEYARAAAIQRRIVGRLGRRCAAMGLRDLPAASTLAGVAPARLCAWDLAEARALALRRMAREVAGGRIDLDGDHERGWRALRAIPGIGSWTVETLALLGQGRHDQLPAGDLQHRKLVGRRLAGGDPRARADEDQVRAFYAPYAPWSGLAAAYAAAGTAGRPGTPLAGAAAA